jgi:3'-phosphoadenosine 5'-phosphosulfate (PAPS) 3'-phosphatase
MVPALQNFQVEMKSDSSPVTRADTAANELICGELMQLAPHIPIISEEHKLQLPYSIRQVGGLRMNAAAAILHQTGRWVEYEFCSCHTASGR